MFNFLFRASCCKGGVRHIHSFGARPTGLRATTTNYLFYFIFLSSAQELEVGVLVYAGFLGGEMCFGPRNTVDHCVEILV